MNLSPTQESLAAIASCTARGDQGTLATQLDRAFDDGSLTLAQAKSAIEQLYAYCGFPRALNALATLLAVVKQREATNKATPAGKARSPAPQGDMTERGAQVQTRLVGTRVTGPLYEFSPEIDHYLKAHLFGDIFADDRLDFQARELVTIAALGSMQGVAPQYEAHVKIGRHNGLTDAQIEDVRALITRLAKA